MSQTLKTHKKGIFVIFCTEGIRRIFLIVWRGIASTEGLWGILQIAWWFEEGHVYFFQKNMKCKQHTPVAREREKQYITLCT